MREELISKLKKDLSRKMVFLTGPRQSGKTWVAKALLSHWKGGAIYLNYDQVLDRRIMMNQSWSMDASLLVFDEIHKMSDWKNFLKGVYDTKLNGQSILVTGSARLDVFRNTGDSLAGRYFQHRLFPFVPYDFKTSDETTIDHLLERSGFPEPYLAENNNEAERWRLQYTDGLVKEDIFTIEVVENLRSLQITLRLLAESVGSAVSYASLSRDVGVSPNTIKKYILLFEALFIIFRVTPYVSTDARSLRKEPKLYFYDLGLLPKDNGKRWENLVGLALLEYCCRKEDREGIRLHLHYAKNKEGKEVDFLIANQDAPERLFEVKWQDDQVSPNLRYFQNKFKIPGIQIVKLLRNEFQTGAIAVVNGNKYLSRI